MDRNGCHRHPTWTRRDSEYCLVPTGHSMMISSTGNVLGNPIVAQANFGSQRKAVNFSQCGAELETRSELGTRGFAQVLVLSLRMPMAGRSSRRFPSAGNGNKCK